MTGLLTFAQASEELGLGKGVYAGRRLRRLVLAKERKAGVEIAVRGGGMERPIRGVRIATLRQHLPEVAPPASPRGERSQLIAEARAYLRDFDERMSEVARAEAEAVVGQLVQPQLDELRGDANEALALCRDLARRLPAILPKGTSENDTTRARKTVSGGH